MKKIFIIVSVLTIGVMMLAMQQDSKTIIVYSSAEQFRNDAMQEQLNEKFPDLQIRVMYTPTAKAAAKLFVEKEGTDADIVVGLETGYIMHIKDSLADVSPYVKGNYFDEFKPENFDNKFVIWERFAGAFVVNQEVLSKYNLDVPETYEDLLKPEYKGLIAMPDPKSSSTGYFYFKNLVNELGETEAIDYFDKLAVNIKQFTQSGSGPIKLLNQGEIAIGLGMTFQAVNEINKGLPLKIIYPPEGSPYSTSGAGIVSGRETDKDIVSVFDFIINDFIYYDKEFFSPELIFKDQVNTIENYPNPIPYANMEGISDMDEKERLLALWRY